MHNPTVQNSWIPQFFLWRFVDKSIQKYGMVLYWLKFEIFFLKRKRTGRGKFCGSFENVCFFLLFEYALSDDKNPPPPTKKERVCPLLFGSNLH